MHHGPGELSHQSFLQPQLVVEDGAEASVECHCSNPWTPGLDTGHFRDAGVADAPGRRLGKNWPKCHLPKWMVE